MNRVGLTGFLLLAVLAVFYLQRQGYSDLQHERFQSGMWQLKRMDSAFNEDLLRVRFSLLENYDVFQIYQGSMERLVNSSWDIPDFVSTANREKISRAATNLSALLQTRRQLFERFKSLNAVLSNSRRYFPVAVDELTHRLDPTQAADQELGALIQQLTRVMLTHASTSEPLTAEDLSSPASLLDWSAHYPNHREAAFTSSLARHARTLLDGKNELDALTRQLLTLPTIAAIEQLSQIYEKDLAVALQRTAQYRTLLYGLALLLAGVIGYALWALRTANRSLGRRVRERTQALERENAERKRAETELAHSLSVLQATIESTADGIMGMTLSGKVLCYNTRFTEIWGIPRELMERNNAKQLAKFVTAQIVDPERFLKQTLMMIDSPEAESFDIIALKDGRTFERCLRSQRIHGEVVGMVTNIRDVTARRRAEEELENVHRQLLDTSRQAGMAEVATSVLHNVGNVLNSVNVSATLVADKVRRSKMGNVSKLSALLDQHRANLGDYLANDPKGKIIPDYLATLAGELAREQATIITELDSLHKNIGHIKDIVSMQQSYAKTSGVVETISIPDLIEDALRMNAGSLARHDVDVARDYRARPVVTLEKNKVLQILVNLVRNAKYACDESGRIDKLLTLRTFADDHSVSISVSDNGVGISPDNLTCIFAHGFTTRKHGHGFGLHSGALAAKELGGSLSVHSDGPNLGATFTLTLPYKPSAPSHE